MNFKVIPVLFTLALVSFSGVALESAFADNVPPQTLFYTTFSGAPNVFSVVFTYDGILTASVGASTALCTTVGADGIAGNPQNSDLLLVGGQNNGRISNCSISSGVVTFVNSPTNVFHVEVTDATTVFGNGIPGVLISHTVNPGGSLVFPGQTYVISTDPACTTGDSIFTQIIDTPGLNGIDDDGDDITFYANNGIYGIITFTGVGTADTCRLHGAGGSVSNSNLAGAHGGVYDPFTQNVITFGGDNIVQLDLAGNIVSSRLAPATGNFDQGTVDGFGHMYIAKNPNLYFLDYSGTSLVGGANFEQLTPLASNLDDIAPLVGMGSTETPIGGTILSINSASLLLAGLQSMTIWMAPILAGAAGVAAFYLKSRKN